MHIIREIVEAGLTLLFLYIYFETEGKGDEQMLDNEGLSSMSLRKEIIQWL